MQTVSYEDVKQCLRLIRNDCSTGLNKMPAMFIKPVVEFLVSPLTFTINNYIATKTFPMLGKQQELDQYQKEHNLWN